MLSDRAIEIFQSKAMGHVAVVDADGRPHVTPVWIDVNDAGELWINTAIGRVKDKYLQMGDAVSVSATDLVNPYEYAQARGTVGERRLDNATADIDHLARKYMDADQYPGDRDGRVTIVIAIDSTTGV